MNLKLLITGTGRCGTVYMARWLTQLGIPCGHESIFDWRGLDLAKKRINGEEKPVLSFCSTSRKTLDGEWDDIPRWLDDVESIQAESSYMAAPFLDQLKGLKILHITRHPVKVINSFCNYIDYFKSHVADNQYESFIYKYLPELTMELPTSYDRCALFYILWNRMIEPYADLRWPIEGDPRIVTDWLGIEGQPFENKKINTFKKDALPFHIHQLQDRWIREELIKIIYDYGYFESKNLIF